MRSSYINRETRDLARNNLNRIAVLTTLKDVIEQRLWVRLGINKREWFLDESLGVPWWDLLDNNASAEQIKAEIYNELMKEEHVKSIEYVKIEEIDRKHRKVNLSFSVIITTGDSISSNGEVDI